MAKTKIGNVTIDLNFGFMKPEKIIDKKTGRDIGLELRRATIKSLSKGLSPVRGQGRLKKYKDPARYPGKRKPPRPVNLKLTEKFYKSLGFLVKKGILTFGLVKASTKVKEYMTVHSEGLPIGKGGPKTRRAWLPLAGEEYNVKIQRKLKLIIQKKLDILIKKSNRR